MIIVEQVSSKLQRLPVAAQTEVLHFVEFLTQKFRQEPLEDEQWSEFSLAQAVKGLEDENLYTEEDLTEKWR